MSATVRAAPSLTDRCFASLNNSSSASTAFAVRAGIRADGGLKGGSARGLVFGFEGVVFAKPAAKRPFENTAAGGRTLDRRLQERHNRLVAHGGRFGPVALLVFRPSAAFCGCSVKAASESRKLPGVRP